MLKMDSQGLKEGTRILALGILDRSAGAIDGELREPIQAWMKEQVRLPNQMT